MEYIVTPLRHRGRHFAVLINNSRYCLISAKPEKLSLNKDCDWFYIWIDL